MKLHAVQSNSPLIQSLKPVTLIFLIIASWMLHAQPPRTYPDYFFPIRPGERNYLAGTMGELRNSHFHGGLDIRTGGRIGLPVYATQAGYISRVQVSSGGFGHALYLTHDDGNISVYAHLNLFEEELETYLRAEQYKVEDYEVRLYPEINQFRFEKGEIIAYSGNTGSSSGPHLHFEIRDQDHRFLNPLEFGFEEVRDEIPPVLKSIVFVTRSGEARVNKSFGKFDFEVIRSEGKFTTRKPVELRGDIGVQVYHYDNQNGSYSRNGVPEIVMFLDDDTVFHEVKESMSFNKNRNILVHYDYSYYLKKRRRFNKLFLEDGNDLDIYHKVSRSVFFDDNPHRIRIVLRDNHYNFSEFSTVVNNRKIVNPEIPDLEEFSIQENHLLLRTSDSVLTVHHHLNRTRLQPFQVDKDLFYFLWDLRKALPDSLTSATATIQPDFYVAVPSGFEFNFYNGDFDITTGRRTLFDTLYLRFEKRTDTLRNLEIFDFKNTDSPFRSNAKITLKPNRSYEEKSGVFSISENEMTYVPDNREDDGSFSFETRELAAYTITYDTVPPIITPVNWSKYNLKVKIEDQLSGIKSYRATIDGQFLLMRYEAKRDMLLAQPKEQNKPLSGEFILEVEDHFGNQNIIRRKL